MTAVSSVPDVAPASVEPTLGRRRAKAAVRGFAVGVAVLLAGLAVPYVITDTHRMSLALDAAILSLLALGIGFLARHLGLISLGHTAFFGGAAYAVGIAITRWGWAPVPAVLFGVVAGTAIALLMGILVVRASGMGFLMLTLALSQALYQLSIQTSARPLTGAHDGLLINMGGDATFFGLSRADVMNPGLFWPFAWIVLITSAILLWLIGGSRFGILLEGIRENEERMRFSGYDTFLPRLAAFVASGAVASAGGALFALNAGYVSPDVLGFAHSADSLIAAMVGGLGTLIGPILGTGAYVYAQANFNVGGNLHLFTGIALITVLVFMPGGVTGTVQKAWRRRRAAAGAERKEDEA